MAGRCRSDRRPHAACIRCEPQTLHALVHWDSGEELHGDESRAVMDNWFRARRRLHDLAGTLHKRRTPLPALRNLYQDLDTEPVIEAFTRRYTKRHTVAPDRTRPRRWHTNGWKARSPAPSGLSHPPGSATYVSS